ncbi:MAG: hypothetical protein GKR89_22770 [Candidatus Latescibacteria bacterium]|nr:hypothetical protein [Candidatus Latescibacterota bacterium]
MDDQLPELWAQQGYYLEKGVFAAAEVGTLLDICNRVLGGFLQRDPDKGAPGDADGRVMRHLNRPDYFTPDRQRALVQLLDFIADERILALAARVLGEEPLFRCTSYWYNPSTRHQDGSWHRDCQFREADEEREKALILGSQRRGTGVQMQVALLETADNEYVPGSHRRWDTAQEYRIRLADDKTHSASNHMPEAVRLRQDPGDIAFFNPMGLHRGRYHIDKPRRTLMLTYTAASHKPFDYFSDQPWFLQSDYLGGVRPATKAFFEKFIAAYAGHWQRDSKAPAPA